MSAKPKKKPGSYRAQRYGILNPWGDVWTPDTFNTMAEAQRHLESFWRGEPPTGLKKFKIAVVKVTVSVVQ